MSYRRFDTDDIVVSADSITAPAWTNNTVNLTTLFTDSTQVAADSGKYYHYVYNSTDASSREIQFSLAHGNRLGSGSQLYDGGINDKSYSSTVYGQFRTLLLGDEDTDFTFDNDGTVETPENVYFISVHRARFKEKLFPGSLTLAISGSTGGNGTTNLKLTDNSKNVATDTFVDGGRVYSLYTGSLGVISSSAVEYGKLFPDVGVIALNGDLLSSSNYLSGSDVLPINDSNTSNSSITPLFAALVSGSEFRLRSDETLSSNFVFVRARNSEFNYSTNPSNITGSGELRHSVMIDNPQSYITSVGLYNDNNDLLAVAKLSTPLLKDFTKEALIRIKLDY